MMATLTGFKQVREQATSQQQQPQQNGQPNPVFVFDEIDVGDGNSITNEVFVDAPTSIINNEPQQQQQKQPIPNTKTKVGTSAGEDNSSSPSVAIEMTNSNEQTNPKPSDQANNQTTNQHEQPTTTTTPPQRKSQQVTSDTKSKMKKTTTTTSGKDFQSATGVQLQKGAQNTNGSQSVPQNLGTPAMPNDGDNVSMSMLAIDCVGTGKSPRTPRRSPLMSLFRGKPRESTRRTYTDEDQFQIEWADLSLGFQKKWYQNYSLTNMLMGGSSRGGDNKHEKPKLILKAVDGRIKSGEITAVLGPSGAGKTSLLNSLFGKYRTAIQGSIRVTGAPTKKHLTVCTIPQSDYLIGYLTTEETLWFASRLKNCENDFNHDKNIERVIELLGLQRCRQTRINKLSGGQYKRVSIAQEMLSSPDILVLDEPTSGLDSLTCYRTVKVLRDLVEASKAHNLINPMSIILTIHQPHREVLDLFHSVYVMAVGGMTMFQGKPAEMEDFIDKHSGTSMPAQGYNPASFMVEIASEEYGRKPIEQMVDKQRQRFRESTKHSYHYKQDSSKTTTTSATDGSLYSNSNSKTNKGDSTISLYPLDGNKSKSDFVDVDLSSTNELSGGKNDKSAERDVDLRIMTPRSGKNSDGVFWRHVNLMSKRCFLSNTRDPLLCTIRVGAHIFIPLVVALIYGSKMGIPNGCPFYKPEINLLEYATVGVAEIQEKHDDIRVQFQNVGLHFMVYYAFGLCMLAFTAISFPLIMHVLIKEIRNGWYSLSTFIIGKMIAELPMAIILPPISVGIIYVMTGQPASYFHWRYMIQSLILILIVMIAEAKGLIFGAICMNSMQTAVFAASVSTVPFILLSGFLIRIREIPYILQGLAQFSYFKHGVEALIITRYGFGMCPCDPDLIPIGGTPRIIGIPANIMSLTDYYINSYVSAGNVTESEPPKETNVIGNNRNIDRIVESTTTLSPDIDGGESSDAPTETPTDPSTEPPTDSPMEPSSSSSRSRRRRRRAASGRGQKAAKLVATRTTRATEEPLDEENEKTDGDAPKEAPKQGVFFDQLANLLTRANAFGFNIESCEDVEPFTMKDMMLKDSQLGPTIGYLFLSILVLKFISYYIVEICVKLKL